MEDEDKKLRTIWIGNLSNRVTSEILYELFLQAGPIEDISFPKDKNGVNRAYAFITYKHQCTIDYAIQLFEGTSLYDRKIRITKRGGGSGSQQSSPSVMKPFMNDQLNNQQMSSSFLADLNKIPPSLMHMPFILSPISPLVAVSLRGQWSPSTSPYQQSPPKNHRQDSNRRYQDRYQSNYYDHKRDDNRNRKRRK